MNAQAALAETGFTRSPKERRGENRRLTEGTGPSGVERRENDRRTSVADRRVENNLQLVTFYLNDEFYGIQVERVQEILLAQERTPVPNAAASIHGLINLRGQIVTSFDLRTALGLPEREADKDPVNVIVKFPDGADSLLVDEIGDLLEVSASQVEPPPATMKGVERNFVEGVCKLDDTLLLILDVDRVTGRVE